MSIVDFVSSFVYLSFSIAGGSLALGFCVGYAIGRDMPKRKKRTWGFSKTRSSRK